ncbi:MAG: tetratricopeptide repeat protein [Treponema sp.]|jgi:tetratricopeptide (TPR) repeat protein|nr:tetratricopeptide repeat protein [Treponema sp.]
MKKATDPAQAEESSGAADYINQGLFHTIKSRNIKAAIAAFTKAITMDRASSNAFFYRGNCFFKNGLYGTAIADYTTAYSLDPIDVRIYKAREWAVYYQKWAEDHRNHLEIMTLVNCAFDAEWDQENDLAFGYFKKALKLCSDNAFIYYQRGLVYHHLNEMEKAIKDFNAAIKYAPLIASVYYDRANVYHLKDMYDKAVKDYTKAIKLYPAFSDAVCNRGVSYFMQNEFDKAAADFKGARRINPNDSLAKSNLGKTLTQRKKIAV